ncbi:hypothetical protein [Edaphobacter aggregans]|uniref:hypothetical protein n=1 Tax=Edaphobacter aggregans TaxID=570835 RepID=UPI0012F78911|nr:hypothetical protein [Edaphobacter aggregans]
MLNSTSSPEALRESLRASFAVVPRQNMQIADRILTHISFVTPVGRGEEPPMAA